MNRSSNAGVYYFCHKVDTSLQFPRCKFGKATNMKKSYEKRGYINGKQTYDVFEENWDDKEDDEDDEEEDYVWNGGEECYAHFMVDWDAQSEEAIVSIVC